MDLLFNLFTEVLISVVRKDHCVCNEDKKAVQKGYLNNFIFSKIYWDTCCFVLNDYCFKPKKIQDTIQKYATPGIDMPLISDFSFFWIKPWHFETLKAWGSLFLEYELW